MWEAERANMTRAKLYSHARIHLRLFQSSTSLSPLLQTSNSQLPLCSCRGFSFIPCPSLFSSPSLHFSWQQTCPVFLQWSKELHLKWASSIQLSTLLVIQWQCWLKRIRKPYFDCHYNLSVFGFLSFWWRLFQLSFYALRKFCFTTDESLKKTKTKSRNLEEML